MSPPFPSTQPSCSVRPLLPGAARATPQSAPPPATGKVDCTEEKPLCSRYNVSGFPSIHWMQHGRTWEHRGPRSKEGLQALVDRMTAPPVKQLALPRDLDELRKASNNGVAFVLGYATGGEHADRAQISGVGHSLFTEVARRQQHMLTFGETESPSVLEAASLPMDGMASGSERGGART